MNLLILNSEIQEFINSNLDSEITILILKGTSFNGVETKELVEQIEAKKRCQKKLPTWFNTKLIYYPNKLNIEQTSSESTAHHKASLTKGGTIIDISGGFGVDSYYFSKCFQSVTHCEINVELSNIVKHNFSQLKIENIKMVPTNGINYLRDSKSTYDWIYVDPSRRHDSKGKVFFLRDCLPNVPKQLDLLFEHSHHIMVKTSPLLDISLGIDELKHVKTVHVVAVNNEVKELLWILEKDSHSRIAINTVNIKQDTNEAFNLILDDELLLEPKYSLPRAYLYEPNSAILKAGAFNSVALQLNVAKLHKHSHLYTSEKLIEFPGRCFKIENIFPYHKKLLKQKSFQKANVTTRNFPETVQQIRNSLKIKDGGTTYLFFTTNSLNEKTVLVCTKVV